MAYQALYRKYRPTTFSDVVGQDYIVTILKNQIASGHVAHAYLFAGTRGTGKTSTAKILARAVNCLSPKDGDSCGKCEACISSLESSPDIIEMDAASNTGVDDIRNLIDKAIYLPIQLTKKVYIIDEAHMMSTSAFNALLKTLEEPPAHVIFILATTEPQKIPATIISRCQRLDFKRITTNDMVKRLNVVLGSAGISIEYDGLIAIARSADGSMRDALSLADQCASFCGDKVSAQQVYSVLGAVDTLSIFRLAEALTRSNASDALLQLSDIIASGRDLSVLLHDLAVHFRAVMMAKLCGECSNMLDCTPDTMRMYQKQAEEMSKSRILRAIDILMQTQNDMRWATPQRVLVETAFVQICHPEIEEDFFAMTDRIESLEKKLKDGDFIAKATSNLSYEEVNSLNDISTRASMQEKRGKASLPTPTEYCKKFFEQFVATVEKISRHSNVHVILLKQFCPRYFFLDKRFVLSFDEHSTAYEQFKRPVNKKILEEALANLDSNYHLEIISESELLNNADDLKSFFGSHLVE